MNEVNQKDSKDGIIQEVRRIKHDLAESMDFDIDRIIQVARQKQDKSGRKIVCSPVRQVP